MTNILLSITAITIFLVATNHCFAQASPAANKSGQMGPPVIFKRTYSAPDLISKTDLVDKKNSDGTFKLITLENGIELRRIVRLKTGSYSVVDKNGNTVPSSIVTNASGCFLCWNNCQEAVRVKCAQ